jgi:hypothetical protein
MTIRPKFTPIAGKAIVVNDEFNGDFIVPTESAIASGFRGRSYSTIIDNFIIKDECVSITTDKLKNAMGDSAYVLDILEAESTAILKKDIVKIVEVLYDIVGNIIANDGDLSKCLKLAHTSLLGSNDFILTHYTVGLRVLAGLNA